MRKLTVLMALVLLPMLALAGTQRLPTTMSAPWGAVTVEAAVTGMSADGAFIYGHSAGYAAHARGQYLYYCRDWTWDLSGTVVAVVDHGGNAFATYKACPPMDPTGYFTNAGGYAAFTTNTYPVYPYHFYAPELTAP